MKCPYCGSYLWADVADDGLVYDCGTEINGGEVNRHKGCLFNEIETLKKELNEIRKDQRKEA